MRELADPRFGPGATSVAGLAVIAGGRDFQLGVTFDLVDMLPPEPVLAPYCFGDGSGAACPCGNAGGADAGCPNSTGAGATLATNGWVSVSADDLAFEAARLVSGEIALRFAGEDALASGGASYGPGLAAAGGWSAGDERHFQIWYRDPVGGPCASGFNLTPAIAARFFP